MAFGFDPTLRLISGNDMFGSAPPFPSANLMEQMPPDGPPEFPTTNLMYQETPPGMNMNALSNQTNHMPANCPQEIQCYENLIQIAGTENGLVLGADGAEFFKFSGLPQEVLHEIWRLADSNNKGYLIPTEFYLACRLIAHAQNGALPSSDLAFMEPVALPNFEFNRNDIYGSIPPMNMMAPQDTTSLSDNYLTRFDGFGNLTATDDFVTGASQGHDGPMGLGSLMDPNKASQGMAMPFAMGAAMTQEAPSVLFQSSTAAADASVWAEALGVSSLQGTPTAGASVWSVSEEEQRKYSALFLRLDANSDGFVEGSDAAALMARSQLSNPELHYIWGLADTKSRGRLSFAEFVVAMRLITSRKKGHALPQSLPPDLEAVLSAPVTPQPPRFETSFEGRGPLDGGEVALAKPEFETDSFAQPTSLNVELAPPARDSPTAKDKSSRRKGKQSKGAKDRKGVYDQNENYDDLKNTFGDMVRDATGRMTSRDRVDGDWNLDGRLERGVGKSKRRVDDGDDSLTNLTTIMNTGDPTSVIEGVIESDKKMQKSINRNIDRLAEEESKLSQLKDIHKKELLKERSELKRQMDRTRDFEEQVSELRSELESINEERRKVDLERISCGRDLSHYQEEAAFLRQQIEDIQKDIELYSSSNAMMDDSISQSEQQVQQLDNCRKNVLVTLKDEKEQLQMEERQVAQLKNTLQRLLRDKEDEQAGAAVKQERLRQANQDRSIMFSAVETKRSELSTTRSQRLALAEEKLSLTKDITPIAQQRVMQGRGPQDYPSSSHTSLMSPSCALQGIDETSSRWTSATPSITAKLHPFRDAKGVPSGAPSYVPTSAMFPSVTSAAGSAKFSSVGAIGSSNKATPTNWTSFGRHSASSAKFDSITRGDPDNLSSLCRLDSRSGRGIHKLNQDDSYDQGVKDNFSRHSETTYLGSRKDDRAFASSSGRYSDFESEADAEKGSKRKPHRSQEKANGISNGMVGKRKDRSTSNSPETKRKTKGVKGQKNDESKHGAGGDGAIRSFKGLETPSFGTPSNV